jgi:hypothetical protein
MLKLSLLTIFMLPLLFIIQGQSGSCRSNKVNTMSQENSERVATGLWGGEHIQMQVTEGGARIEYDCAHGTIEEPLVLDSQGRFEAKGAYVREPRGPVRMGENYDGRPARFTGSVNGKEMTITVTLTDKQQTISTFTLNQGENGRIRKCQ